jgi:thiol-disulfide isomerase/thioredoxin
MSSPHRILAGLAFLAAVALAPTVARAEVRVGDRFPSLAGAGLGGGVLPATEGKVVLVDFWASWCAPCKASFPAYARIQSDYSARGLVIVAVSVDESARPYAAFLKQRAPTFATVRDETQQLVRMVRVPAMPTSYLLDRSGRVRFIHVGFHSGETERAIRAEIETLLAEKP